MKELRFDPEIDEVVTFSEFAYFHGNQLSEEEKIELWFQNELAIGVAADFPEDDDIANDVGDGFGVGLGSCASLSMMSLASAQNSVSKLPANQLLVQRRLLH